MNIKRLFAIALALCLVLCLCACGETSNNETTEGTTTEGTTETTAAATDDTAQQNTNPTYTVKVVDEGGNPVAGAMVQICQGETCLPGATGEDGVATFQVVEAEYKVSFLAAPEGYEVEEAYYFEDGSYDITITVKAVA